MAAASDNPIERPCDTTSRLLGWAVSSITPGPQERKAAPGSRVARRGLLICALALVGCAVDAVVYRSDPADDAVRQTDDSAVRTGIPDQATICREMNGGARAVLTDIVARLREDFLVPGMPCTVDEDCRRTLITPACDSVSRTCVLCPNIPAQVDFGLDVGFCIASAAQVCCGDPKADPDCIVRMCAVGCVGEQQ